MKHTRYQIPDLPRNRPTVTQVLPHLRAIYASSPVGCHLHIAVDDGNLRTADLERCVERAMNDDCIACIATGEAMIMMSSTQRRKLRWLSRRRA